MCSIIGRNLINLAKRSQNQNVLSCISLRLFCTKEPPSDKNSTNSTDAEILGSIGTKYQVFKNEESTPILDINEERFKYAQFLEEQEEFDIYAGLNLNRGLTGVYDIEDLVQVLRRENGVNICVISVSPQLKYVDYICIVSGRSYRHMLAIAQFVRRVYKKKRNSRDIIPKIEGENSKEWIAMDLGNIALHIFSNEAREKYDLESLWSIGPEYDEECNKPDDPIVTMLEKLSIYQRDLKPLDRAG